MNKKKLVALITCLMLIVAIAVGGTLAYFTDTDAATNVFTFGKVTIEQHEQERTSKTDATIKEFTEGKNVYPAVHEKLNKSNITVDGYTFPIRSLEGNYVDKIVNVENKGTEPAYIRTIFAIPNMNGYDDSIDASENPLHWNYLDASDNNGIGWDWNGKDNEGYGMKDAVKVNAVEIGGVEYDLYVATYNAAVAANAKTLPSLVGFYLDNSVDYDETGYFSYQAGERIELNKWIKPDENGKVTMKILVATQATQTEGFADAWEALDKAFGAITATNHPWNGEVATEGGNDR